MTKKRAKRAVPRALTRAEIHDMGLTCDGHAYEGASLSVDGVLYPFDTVVFAGATATLCRALKTPVGGLLSGEELAFWFERAGLGHLFVAGCCINAAFEGLAWAEAEAVEIEITVRTGLLKVVARSVVAQTLGRQWMRL